MALTISLDCLIFERIPKFTSIIIFLKWKLNLEKILSFFGELLPSRIFPQGLGLGFKVGARSGAEEAMGDWLSAFGLGEEDIRD